MDLVYQSRHMQDVVTLARRYSRSSATVLVSGESGTGKELMARMIHESSPRVHSQYVRVNCASLNRDLIESELFGHEPGAFTGATQRREGRFEFAGSGTLLLDEIGELDLNTQAKLLRVLEEREYQRVGSNDLRVLETRIIASTNRDLSADVANGRFRLDLLHRLGVLVLEVPPLRSHREDIPALVTYFIKRFGDEGEGQVRGVSCDVMKSLTDYHWPGNVRQLRNVIHCACVLSDSDTVTKVTLPDDDQVGAPAGPASGAYEHLTLQEVERRVILERLQRFDGNRTETAAALGVTTRTLRNKLASYRNLEDAA